MMTIAERARCKKIAGELDAWTHPACIGGAAVPLEEQHFISQHRSEISELRQHRLATNAKRTTVTVDSDRTIVEIVDDDPPVDRESEPDNEPDEDPDGRPIQDDPAPVPPSKRKSAGKSKDQCDEDDPDPSCDD